MVEALNLYVDDSGSRHPDRLQPSQSTPAWFGLGGILVREADEGVARDGIAAFRTRWQSRMGDAPLHSYEIRQKKGPFAWLQTDLEARGPFYAELTELVATSPVLCTACVIDRNGYIARYFPKYDRSQRWSLCKTAFSVLLERAAKYARRAGCVLRVFVERTDKVTDAHMRDHYDQLRAIGMPFDPNTMATYQPLDAASFHATLYDFKTKNKSSPMMQLADLFLYPLCRGGYDRTGRDYLSLVDNRKLIDCALAAEDVPLLGVKYSCFDAATPKTAA